MHIKSRQVELHRLNGVIKPKPSGVPTIFNILNPPKISDTIR